MRRVSSSVMVFLLGACFAASSGHCDELNDLHFGEALYYSMASSTSPSLARCNITSTTQSFR
jgi:hypothetical protein